MIEASLFPSRFVAASEPLTLARASTGSREEIPRGGRRSVAVMGELARRLVGGIKVGSALPGQPPIEAAPPPARPRASPSPDGDGGIPGIPGSEPPTTSPPTAPAPAPSPWPTPVQPTSTRPVSFHFTDAIAGGSSTSEVRVYGPVAAPYRIKTVVITPIAGVTAGQFVDVLTSADGDVADSATPTGQSVFDQVLAGSIPSPDATRGLAVPSTAVAFNVLAAVPAEQQYIKVLLRFASPAVALPDVSVTLVLEQFAGSPVLVEPRPAAPEPRIEVAEEPPYIAPAPASPTTETIAEIYARTGQVPGRTRSVILSNGRTIPVLVPTGVVPQYRTEWARNAAAGITARALYSGA
jgi:hypothetical protein